MTIVGAGPAGTTAAKNLAESGIDVLLIDKNTFPREKPCGGALSLSLLNTHPALEKLVDTNVLAGCIASGDNKHVLHYDSGERLGALVQRSSFDHSLLTEARKAGAEVIEGERVTNVEFDQQAVVVSTDKGQYRSDVVIGAGGTHDLVAKKSGLNPGWKPDHVVLSYVVEHEFPETVMDDYFTTKRRLFFHLGFKGNDGYGWVFPKERHLNVGFGALSSTNSNLKQVFLDYVKFCQDLRIVPPFSVSKMQAALIPMRRILPRVWRARCMLVGDAAGFINPINSEGIQYAIESAEIAARVTSKMVRSRDFSNSNCLEYQNACMAQFGRRLNGLRFLSKMILKHSTLVIKSAENDPILKDLALKMLQNAGNVAENKRKLINRFIRNLVVNTVQKKH